MSTCFSSINLSPKVIRIKKQYQNKLKRLVLLEELL